MQEHLQKADTPRLRSRMQIICSVISISVVILRLMVKITSFRLIEVLKNGMA